MASNTIRFLFSFFLAASPYLVSLATAAEEAAAEKPASETCIDSDQTGWIPLTGDDFVNVNGAADTWRWEEGTRLLHRQTNERDSLEERYTNFEMVCQWVHRSKGGNSGIFVWTEDASIERLTKAGKPGLPHGIEIQVLDLGYAEKYEKQHKKPADWFTSHGDVFPTGTAKMKPFPPVAPNGTRSFPSKHVSKGVDEWNHYCIRCVDGVVWLWVNGEKVSGGSDCEPRSGYICLESEGAPVEYKDLRIRELP